MTYGLPTRGQRDWDDELNNSVESLRSDAQAAVAASEQARSNATSAITIAQDAAARVDAFRSIPDAATASLVTDGPLTSAAVSTAIAHTQPRTPLIGSKVVGGNITVKPGYDWRHLWAEWDWDNWIKPQVDRAVILGCNTVRLIGAPRLVFGGATWAAWAASTAITADTIRVNDARAYRAKVAGTTAASGGPTGTGDSIVDGTVTWEYVRENDLTQATQSEYDERWAQLALHCLQRGLNLYPCIVTAHDATAVNSSDMTDAAFMASVTATAEALSAYPNVIAFDVFQEGDDRTGTAWTASQDYSTVGTVVNNGGLSYILTTAGTSAASGGPSGSGTGITDGTCVWNFNGIPVLVSDALAWMAAIRAVSNVPLTMSASATQNDDWNNFASMWYLTAADEAGSDFIDVHIYNGFTLPQDMDYLMLQTGKPLMVGEFGANQSQTTDAQAARYEAVLPIHNREGVIGSLVWALADQASYTDAGKAGIWDNTGFTQGSSPLSTTVGQRASLSAILRQFRVAQPAATPYEPPNLFTPARANPPRNLAAPNGRSSFWNAESNTTRVADGRGVGFQCIAGGTQTGAYVASTSREPLHVEGNTWYLLELDLVADSIGRTVSVFVDWYSDAATLLNRTDTFTTTDAVNMPVTLRVLVKSHASATIAAPYIRWSASQATGEIHVLRGARLTLA